MADVPVLAIWEVTKKIMKTTAGKYHVLKEADHI
jgi:hypothetical protein